ncbi:MAG: glycerophosphodiester phosphodiesterase [Bacteroidales bacterium]|nr:glycerophosphodiester phosphodiesterase [Bacteroidales bacterium]
MKRLFYLAALALAVAGCNPAPSHPKTAIIAHRGFWNCEEAAFSENSIASLRMAQEKHFWGSEFDLQLSADDTVMVNHNPRIRGMKIADHPWSDFIECYLPNGERRPTLHEYLDQGAKSKTTMLVMEFKKQDSEEREDRLVELALEALKGHNLYDPQRVMFISFSLHICKRIAELAPEFANQYLGGDLFPEDLKELGISGWDYNVKVVDLHRDWVARSRELGLSTNVWTVNKAPIARDMLELGVEAVTTDEPLLLRNLLKRRENKR